MPTQTYAIGEVLVYDGSNAAEIAAACQAPAVPDAGGGLTVTVPLPLAGPQETHLRPGDGLVLRPGGTFLPATAASLALHTLP